MRKKNIFLVTLFFIIVLFGFNDEVYAAKKCKSVDCKDEIAEVKAKSEKDANVKLVCSYAVQNKDKPSEQYANYIYYNINEKTFYASSTIKDFYGELTSGYPRYVLGDAKEVLESFNRCPRYSYIDFKGNNEICFDSDNSSCQNFDETKNNYGTKDNSKLIDDLVSQYKDYDNTFKGVCDKDNAMVQKYGNFCRYADDEFNYILVYYNNNSSTIVVRDADKDESITIDSGKDATFYTTGFSNYWETYYNEIYGLNSCPSELYLTKDYSVISSITIYKNYIYGSSAGLTKYTTDYKLTPCVEEDDVTVDNSDDVDCEVISDTIRGYINDVMSYIRIGVPILLLCLIIYDFASATFASSEDKMKKAQGRVIKRIIIAIVIFFVPTLINLVFDIVNDVWSKNYQICGIAEYEK